MVRFCGSKCPVRFSFPHPRGDGPSPYARGGDCVRFSPPAWGWSVECFYLDQQMEVFPTRVGMVRFWPLFLPLRTGFPHPRGDGPVFPHVGAHRHKFSPPAWGWSETVASYQRPGGVFPTRVGMVR